MLRSLFTSFHAIWENPPEQEKDRRSLHLLLEQLRFLFLRETNAFNRSGTVLSSHYALYHSLGLLADLIRLVFLHCLENFFICGSIFFFIDGCMSKQKSSHGSLLLLTLYTFHFADEDVSATISSFLNSDMPAAEVTIVLGKDEFLH